MSDYIAAEHDPEARANIPTPAGLATPPGRDGYDGTTYYGRPQLKEAPFENWVVGGYIFLAGLSGATQILSTIAEFTRGKTEQPATRGVVRRGRYLSLLAPTLGSALLIYDLHTPQRFYNMLRIFKRTSPMSIGTWILSSFGVFSGATFLAQLAMDLLPARRRGLRRAAETGARTLQLPAALAGAGLGTYTAALLSATSTPLWAAAPRGLAVRFGGSSIAAGAAALALGEKSVRTGRTLDAIAVAALAVELGATLQSKQQYRTTGVSPALDSAWGRTEQLGATAAGTVLPLGLYAVSLMTRGRPRILSRTASLAVLAGSLLFRVSIMGAGDVSARTPQVSLRFSQKDNLPRQ